MRHIMRITSKILYASTYEIQPVIRETKVYKPYFREVIVVVHFVMHVACIFLWNIMKSNQL